MLDQIVTSELPLSQKTAELIIDYIKSSGLKSGSKMPNETELCKRLGVSRCTVREAIKLLVSRNILIINRGVGTFVSSKPGQTADPLGLEFVEDKKKLLLDLMQFRTIIEPTLVKLATLNASQDEISNLTKIESQLEEAYRCNKDTTEADIAFHSAIAKCSQNQVVDAIFPVLVKAIPAINQYTEKSLMDDTIADHKAIIQACKDRNAELAEMIMLQHLKRNTDFVEQKAK